MAANLITYEKALKENFLPAWNNLAGIEPSALIAKMKKVPLTNNKIVATAPFGLSGGFGFGAEGQATPKSGGVNFERFESTAKDMYCNVVISAKAVQLTGSAGSMADALSTEVQAAYDAAKWNLGRSLFGDGTGKLASVTANATKTTYDGKEAYLTTVDNVRLLKEGLTVDFCSPTGGALASGRIVSIDRAAKKVLLVGCTNPTEIITATRITVQNSLDREITGLGAIFNDDITSIYGITKASHEIIRPINKDAGGSISDSVITKALREAKNIKGSNVDLICCGDTAYDNYLEYLRDMNVRVEDSTRELDGGHKAIKFVFGNNIVDIVNESFVPENEMWGVDTSALEFHAQEWKFLELQNGGIFTLINDESNYRALLANYGEMMCKNPGGCVRITNC